MKSKHLWLPAEDLVKLSPINTASYMGDVFMKVHSSLRNYELLMVSGREITFLW